MSDTTLTAVAAAVGLALISRFTRWIGQQAELVEQLRYGRTMVAFCVVAYTSLALALIVGVRFALIVLRWITTEL